MNFLFTYISDILYNNYQKLTKSSHDKLTQKYYLNNGANERNNKINLVN